MSEIGERPPLPPAGWYADPQAPTGPTGRRYWDGTGWTGHVVADPVAAVPLKAETTPDGQQLARWGRRLAAYAVDAAITWALAAVLGFPLLRSMIEEYVDLFRRSVDAAESGGRPPGQLDIYREVYPELLGYAAIALVVVLVYHSFSLRAWSATPGKLLLGLRVRPLEGPGRLSWSMIARRVGSTWVLGIVVGTVPVVGSLGGLYLWLDGLWPLWDQQRRALHDKVAGTAVVRV
ncbi:RDD family protein [Marmoricola endophyticus]|uniref:RDD family protein n=1 Tax=Marmoricola endophyticus TaxID=2040280 RepID=UPI00166703EE|nr:RDD family protein [Marmoricola endophyticus]